MQDEDEGGTPACYAHLLVDGHSVDPQTARDVARFRRAKRSRLIAARRRMAVAEREAATARLIRALDHLLASERRRIAVYWPIGGEPDLRGWMEARHDAGAEILLPVVARPAAPLEFHRWTPGCAMTRGHWNIPEPVRGETLRPDVVIAPLVGCDAENYRLGHGGGYYDRTLARIEPMPWRIGVGFTGCRLKTIFPMPWDIPMDRIVLSDEAVV